MAFHVLVYAHMRLTVLVIENACTELVDITSVMSQKVPVIIPLVVKIWCTKKELSINMKEQEKKYPSSVEIKNLRVLKIVFPIVVTTVVALFVPSAVPLIGMLMFGNLIKEIGSDTSRLFDAASNSIMNAATIFLGLSVGATMTTEAFFELDYYRHCGRWFLGVCLVYFRWYLVCEVGESFH